MKCIVFGCNNNYKIRKKNKKLSFFRFPDNKFLKSKWLETLKNNNLVIGKDQKICSAHFPPCESFVATTGLLKGKRLLVKDAVPSINLPKCDVSDLEYQQYNKALFRLKHKRPRYTKQYDEVKEMVYDNTTYITCSDSNIVVKEELRDTLEMEIIKGEPGCTYEISILEENEHAITNDETHRNSQIHIEPTKGKDYQFCDNNNLTTCFSSNRLKQVENRQDLLEKKLDELLDLVRDISRRIRS